MNSVCKMQFHCTECYSGNSEWYALDIAKYPGSASYSGLHVYEEALAKTGVFMLTAKGSFL